ncbi:MAG TPA: hypothetical protein VHV81_14680, partial [Steroidobacteraceae bacterium]|nr:hypothetical protein [Steroidobacteraceae bacterium]
AATTGHQIKWNPGHYMASYGIVRGGGSSNFVRTEMDDLNNHDAILGYRMLITWSALEPTEGHYDFSVIDAALARLKTAYNKPKRLVVMVVWYSPSSWSSGDGSVVPLYIQQDPKYGASPVAGSYGWWGRSANGASTGMYAPAVYYPPVMDRLVAMVQALGNHLDADPNFEALFVQENSAIVQAAAGYGNNDPHYSDPNWLAQLERLLTASTAAFPHTSVIMGNAYFANGGTAVALEQWMADNRIAAGTADSFGQSGIAAHNYKGLSDGVLAYLGQQTANGGTVDLRPKMTAMFDVESGDMTTTYFGKWGGPFAPLDILTALNQTYKASHAFWTRMVGSTPAPAQWVNVAAMCAANPLLRTAYPANYP